MVKAEDAIARRRFRLFWIAFILDKTHEGTELVVEFHDSFMNLKSAKLFNRALSIHHWYAFHKIETIKKCKSEKFQLKNEWPYAFILAALRRVDSWLITQLPPAIFSVFKWVDYP
jgi:hypothetical protein